MRFFYSYYIYASSHFEKLFACQETVGRFWEIEAEKCIKKPFKT